MLYPSAKVHKLAPVMLMPAWKRTIALTLTAALSLCWMLRAEAAAPQPQRTVPTLIVDAGHGGEDGGAVSLTGRFESQLNLEIAQRVEQLCGLCAVPVLMLRQADVSLADPDAKTIRQKKVSDLKNRVETVNQTPNAVLLSIHQNFFEGKNPHGAQVFYRDADSSQGWAELLQTTLQQYLDPANTRTAAQVPKFVYLMKHIRCPAVLVECGFLSNPEEEARLSSDGYQKKLALVLTVCSLAQLRGDALSEQYKGEVEN